MFMLLHARQFLLVLWDISALAHSYTVLLQDINQDYLGSAPKPYVAQKLILSFLYLLHKSNDICNLNFQE